ncbi:MAG: DUF6114 domain-containing protein [Candidatus Geothermarchaeales archaeon]
MGRSKSIPLLIPASFIPCVRKMGIYGSDIRASEDFIRAKERVHNIVIVFSMSGGFFMTAGGVIGLLRATENLTSFVDFLGENQISFAGDSMIRMWIRGIQWTGLDPMNMEILLLLSWIGLASGISVMGFSIMLFVRPVQRVAWGILMVVASLASLAGLGGFVLGMALGVVGGFLAMS